MTSMTGKTVLITGGSGGIGAALARRFAARGATIALADTDPSGRALADTLGGVFLLTDVSRPEDNDRAVRAVIDRFGHLDVAVLNAGIGERGAFLDGLDLPHYRELVAVNLDGVVFGLNSVLPHLTEQGAGAVLATASLAGIVESPFNPLYAATKHAVVGLVRSVAPLVAEQGVTVNALCPGFIDTPILQGFAPQLTAAGIAVLPPDRVADVAEVALESGQTGQAWPVLPHREPAQWPFSPVPSLMSDPDHVLPETS